MKYPLITRLLLSDFMASFQEHINQAKKNLLFLNTINNEISECWDWQVTVCFYVSVHLVNAHIANKTNQHYRSHEQVNEALNPFKPLSIAKLSEEEYKAYIKLQGLSRRSRYLCSDNLAVKKTQAFFTYDRHLSKAIKNLDRLLNFIKKEYSVEFDILRINCIDIHNNPLHFFQHKVV